MRKRWLLSFFFLLAVCGTGWAQSRVTGTVTDSSGAVVPGVEVVIRNVATGQAVTAQTNQSGVYSISFLNPGQYELTCEQSGFKKFVRAGIVLETSTTSTVDVVLNVGQISDVINVTAASPLLESETGALGQLVENKMILDMPIESRRVGALVRLMGNITFTGEDGGQSIPKFSLAGGRSYNQMWTLDGGVAQNQSNGSPQLSLNPPNESLQEFKVLANNYPAEYGRSGSGFIVMTTRGGTNDLHGAAYEWLRNDKLNARTFFSAGKAPLRYNIFGGSLGGPIRKNKTFFFFNYEGGRRRTGVTVAKTVPQPAEVAGDFSARKDIKVLDPATRVGSTAAQPFPNNVIPASRIDPMGKAFAALYPAPNQPGNDPTKAPSSNYRANTSDPLLQDFYTTRIDHQIREADRLFGRVTIMHAPEEVAAAIPNAIADDRAFYRENENRNFLVSWNHNLRPTVINEFRYMLYNRKYVNRGYGARSGFNGKLNLPGVSGEDMARIGVTGLSTLGQSTVQRVQNPIQTHQFGDGLFWVKNNHSIKTGIDVRRSSNVETQDSSGGGYFSFSDRATNNGLASLLLGWVNSGTLVKTDVLNSRSNYFGLYIQDDWKVTPKLTLNLGLRWEIDFPRWEAKNRQSGFDAFAINPVSRTPGVVTFAGVNGEDKYSHEFDANNWGPRFGFAYTARKGLVLRGGYGIFYNGSYYSSVNNTQALGFSLNGSFTSPDGGYTPAFLFRTGMPAISRDKLGPEYGAVPVGAKVTTAPDFIARDHVNGYSQQWNFTIQKELPGNILWENAYIANVGHKLGSPDTNINQIPLVNGRGPAVQDQTKRRFPQFGNVTSISPSWGNSTYHSLNVKVEKRFSHGLNMLGNYTWAKFLDDVEASSELGGGNGNGYQHMDARGLDKAMSGSDIRHRVAYSSLYELPVGKGRRFSPGNAVLDHVIGGWTVGGILEARTGPPYGVTENTNRLNAFSESQRPNLLRDPNLPGGRTRDEMIRQFFDTAAFQAPGDGVLGNAARTLGPGPGFFGVDVSIHKLFRLTESFGLTFRADVVNLPNMPAFGAPGQARGDGNFGKINSTLASATAREIQLSLRLAW
ncbi:MAG: TonB-dependent receptor domain-containing protein [Bryobacteraceae bacterium]